MVWGPTVLSLNDVPTGRLVSESSQGPTATKSDRTGRNPWMTRLARRSSAMSRSGGTAFFSVGRTIRYVAYQKKQKMFFTRNFTFGLDKSRQTSIRKKWTTTFSLQDMFPSIIDR